MTVRGISGWRIGCGLAWLAAAVLSLPVVADAQSAPPSGSVTFTKDIAPVLQRSCENCHRARRRGADGAVHLRTGASLGPRDQAADEHRAACGRDAALVRREEHRHPAVSRTIRR